MRRTSNFLSISEQNLLRTMFLGSRLSSGGVTTDTKISKTVDWIGHIFAGRVVVRIRTEWELFHGVSVLIVGWSPYLDIFLIG